MLIEMLNKKKIVDILTYYYYQESLIGKSFPYDGAKILH